MQVMSLDPKLRRSQGWACGNRPCRGLPRFDSAFHDSDSTEFGLISERGVTNITNPVPNHAGTRILKP